ncbi:MAG: sulfide-dependent adenosine diphosphate thiazole synthase [Candidatus Sumerlaeota bacterium]|nr:sulfide-dependent adenosine diphosphate thiazole synthase [Candidatus Sumerlaeota bacterium]
MEQEISRAIIQGYAAKLEDCIDCDLAVVGAGPSGLLCAYYLAKAGKKAVIFEKKLAPGGGVWGGAMLFNEVVIQQEAVHFLDELGIRYQRLNDRMVRADSVELASCLIYRAVNAGARLFNGVSVEDVMFKDRRICGVVINYTPILLANLHVDPLTVAAHAVLDGSGHHAELTAKAARKAGIRLETPTGDLMGEKPMWAEEGERATVENTRRVYPGLYVSGMAANGVFGSPRMGPIFGGMLLSGQRAAEIILKDLG